MTAPTLQRPVPARGRNGGRPARLAVVRWAWRLVKSDWRQQTLVIALLTFTVTVAVAGASAVYNVPKDGNADFGSGSHAILVRGSGSDPALVMRSVAAARDWFGTTDVITRTFAKIPGTNDEVELRGQDPAGPYGASLLRLRTGSYPTATGDVAITDGIAKIFGVGGSLQLPGQTLRVVGLVENPTDLADEFALVAAGTDATPQSARALIRASDDRFVQFAGSGVPGVSPRRPEHRRSAGAAAAGVLALSTLVLLLVGLIAAASFTVLAGRRLRQIGMLAAVGATVRHVRLVMVVNGFAIGAVSALLGSVLGLLAWAAGASRLESVVEHRISVFNVPWLTLVAMSVLAIGAATAAAWMPARSAARIPITAALSARPPTPKRTHRSAFAAVLLIAAGCGSFVLADEDKPLWMIAGVVATTLGLVFASPVAVRALSSTASRLPLASRLAVRDMGRYEARSGSALAAISLSLAIAVTIVVTATAAGFTADTGNLPPNQMLVALPTDCPCLVPQRTPAEHAVLQTSVDKLAAGLGAEAVIPLDVAAEMTAPESSRDGGDAREVSPPAAPGGAVREASAVSFPVVSVGKAVGGDTVRDLGAVYVATPQLLGHLGLDLGQVDPQAEVLTGRTGVTELANVRKDAPQDIRIARINLAQYSSAPRSLITPAGLARGKWTAVRAGWLLTSGQPLTADQISTARAAAVDAGLTIEVRNDSRGLGRTRSAATAFGMLLALAVLAMTVGLIRSETAADLRTLSASGASSGIRRGLTATTAGAMGLLGVVLGSTVAYLALIAAYSNDLDRLRRVPVLHLAIIIVGVPILAYVAGWVFAARDPDSIATGRLD